MDTSHGCERRTMANIMANILMIAPLNAANFDSGNAEDGRALTADGQGGAMWRQVLPPFMNVPANRMLGVRYRFGAPYLSWMNAPQDRPRIVDIDTVGDGMTPATKAMIDARFEDVKGEAADAGDVCMFYEAATSKRMFAIRGDVNWRAVELPQEYS